MSSDVSEVKAGKTASTSTQVNPEERTRYQKSTSSDRLKKTNRWEFRSLGGVHRLQDLVLHRFDLQPEIRLTSSRVWNVTVDAGGDSQMIDDLEKKGLEEWKLRDSFWELLCYGRLEERGPSSSSLLYLRSGPVVKGPGAVGVLQTFRLAFCPLDYKMDVWAF
ncbi:hypothetical protein EYF80_060701 [Liparis tanakae]|uniref:Uncharacterized protein n=1 Tax=Liparis tanakae TaxID=230148 RepID=A0A4Z2ELB2_9TELE|nr:hypothetical protein EYF80_060701 [Liparis tanakae]